VVGNVTTLDHKLVDDSVEGGLGIGQAIVLASAELAEAEVIGQRRRAAEAEEDSLLSCAWSVVFEKLHSQTPNRLRANGDVEEAARAVGNAGHVAWARVLSGAPRRPTMTVVS